jgi:hypothetical protein
MNEGGLNKGPVFVVGAARSGTTWVQCLIGAMEGFYSCPETHFFDELLPRNRIRGGYQLHRPRYRSWPRLVDKGHLLEILEKADRGFLRISNITRRALLADASNGKLDVRTLLERLIVESAAPGSKGRRWIEKTPTHASYLAEIFGFFPDAQVVCVLRGPEAVFESAARMFDAPVSIAAIDYWRSYRNIRRFLNCNPARRANVLMVTYERLLKGNDELEALRTFLGVGTFDPAKVRSRAVELFSELYGNTFVYHVQAGMGVTALAAGNERQMGVLTRVAARVAGRVLRSWMQLDDLPAAAPPKESWFIGVVAMLLDLGRGIGYATKWRANDMAQSAIAWLPGRGVSHVR